MWFTLQQNKEEIKKRKESIKEINLGYSLENKWLALGEYGCVRNFFTKARSQMLPNFQFDSFYLNLNINQVVRL